MGLGRKLVKSSLTRTFGMMLQIMVAFVMTPLIVHSLGARMYGFWVFVGTFLGYYGLLDLGLSSAVSRYISRAVGLDDSDEIRTIVSTSFALYTIIGVIVLCISVLAILLGSNFFTDRNELMLFRKMIALLGVSMAIGFPLRGVFGGLLDANLRYDLSAYAAMIRLVTANTAIYILLKSGFGILAMAVASFASGLLEYAMIVFFARKTVPALRLDTSCFSPNMVKQLFGYSGKTFVAQLADLLRFKADNAVIAAYLDLSRVTYYSVGAKLVEYFGEIMGSVTGIMAPVFSQYEGRGDYDTIRERFLDVTQICVILSAFIGVSIMFYGRWFIARWMGPGFESSYNVAVILCISSTIALMQTSGISLLYGISKHQYYAIANTCEGILNLILSLILVKYYGMYGVALGTTLEMLLFKLFIQPIFVCRAINLSVFKYYFETIFITTIKTVVPLAGYLLVIKDFMKAEYMTICTFAGTQCVLFVIMAYAFILGDSNKQLVKRAIGFAR
jgi:O-antigen/teichoic acid export membrane protein